MELTKTGQHGHWEQYQVLPSATASVYRNANEVLSQYGQDTAPLFPDDDDELFDVPTLQVNVGKQAYDYVPYGDDDNMPLTLRRLIGSNMITAQCMAYNTMICYAQGLQLTDRETGDPSTDPAVRRFCLRNSLHEYFMEQATDMKYYNMAATEIILNRERTAIVGVKHLDACYCRLEKRRETDGRIPHLFYGDFRHGTPPRHATAIPLLDTHDPFGDLMVRTGQWPDPKTGERRTPENAYKYAIVTRMPTAGCRYYPIPSYVSIFRDNWYDIYRLIGIGKKNLIKNTSAPRLQIEVHEDYWQSVCDYENINDEEQRRKRIDEEHQNLIDFVCGAENAGKAMISNYYIDPNGKENRMVRIYPISESRKEGGDWSDDIEEAANMLCFALGVHPNLIGATPGKSQMNNSGSDKRELFILKQSMEKATHDIMLLPLHVALHYNGWADQVTATVPYIQPTTLDKGKDFQTAGGTALLPSTH